MLRQRKKRARKKDFTISGDEYGAKNELKFYSYEKPVVVVSVLPRPKLTAGSKIFNTVSFLAVTAATVASLGAGAPLMAIPFMMGKRAVKKDFMKMKLRTVDKQQACIPYNSGRHPYNKATAEFTDYYYKEFIDKVYAGYYEFDARCFDTEKPIELVINTEGESKTRTVKVPERIKKRITEDFKPYWQHVAMLKKRDFNEVISDKEKMWIELENETEFEEEDISDPLPEAEAPKLTKQSEPAFTELFDVEERPDE